MLVAVGAGRSAWLQRARQTEEYAQILEVYRPYGLVFEPKAGRLYYQQELVRYFEDITDETRFLQWPCRDGAVDVYAVRDATGTLVGVTAFDLQAFQQRTPSLQDASGELESTESIDGYTADVDALVKDAIQDAYAVYEPYGLTYDRQRDRLYYQTELVGYFEDAALKHSFGPFEDSKLTIYALRDGQGNLTGLDVREAGA